MGDKKNIIIVVLIIVIIIMGYMLVVSFPNKAEAECRANIETQVMSAVQECQQTVQQLMQIPACVSALAQ